MSLRYSILSPYTIRIYYIYILIIYRTLKYGVEWLLGIFKVIFETAIYYLILFIKIK